MELKTERESLQKPRRAPEQNGKEMRGTERTVWNGGLYPPYLNESEITAVSTPLVLLTIFDSLGAR